MPTLYDLKPRFQRLLRPAARALARAGATPNQVTVAALALSCAGGAAVCAAPSAAWPLVAMPVVLLARMALNALDGMLARDLGAESRLGAVLNEAGDVASDCALYLPLALVPGVSGPLVAASVALAAATEAAGLAGLRTGAGRRHDGPMGKSDRAFAFGALAVALALGASGAWASAALGAVLALQAATVSNRLARALGARARAGA